MTFVPLYRPPELRKMFPGKPIHSQARDPMEAERKRIREYLMERITNIACGLPEHTAVPYRNIPQKYYPKNTPTEEHYEEARC